MEYLLIDEFTENQHESETYFVEADRYYAMRNILFLYTECEPYHNCLRVSELLWRKKKCSRSWQHVQRTSKPINGKGSESFSAMVNYIHFVYLLFHVSQVLPTLFLILSLSQNRFWHHIYWLQIPTKKKDLTTVHFKKFGDTLVCIFSTAAQIFNGKKFFDLTKLNSS